MSWNAELEQRLCQEASRGDREAMQRLLERFADPLFAGVILPRVGNRADAEDILREALLRAVEKMPGFTWRGGGFWSWLRVIAVHLVADHGRRLQARRRLESGFAAEVRSLPPRIEPGAEAALIEEEERRLCREQLAAALESINDRYRRAIELRIVEGRSREESAAALDVSVATFDVVLHRALKALRKRWPEGT